MSRNPPTLLRLKQTDTLSFRRWFGESKVADAFGKPLTVYHGTVTRPDTARVKSMGDIIVFDRLFTTAFRAHSVDTLGSWFSSIPGDGGAQMYAGGGTGAVIYPVYLSIQNPLETTFALMERRSRLLVNGQDDGRPLGEAEVNAYRKWLRDIGKDGIKIVHDEYNERGSTEFKYQDAWIALEPTQVKSAIGNAGEFSAASADIRHSFAGRHAETADMHAQAEAEMRLKLGEDREIVRKETGWFKGVDDKWRFEISDDGVKFAEKVYFAERDKWYPARFLRDATDAGSSGQAGLEHVIEHPTLFAAYPQLRQMPVEGRIRKSHESGSFDGKKLVAQASSPQRLLNVILHEIQHGIQDVEAFARGGSMLDESLPTDVEMARKINAKYNDDREAIESSDEYKEFIDKCLSELPGNKRYIPSPRDSSRMLDVGKKNAESAAFEKFVLPLEDKRRSDVEKFLTGSDYSGTGRQNVYHRLAGEVEARNVQTRHMMTQAERRETSPAVTSDVPDHEVILSGQTGLSKVCACQKSEPAFSDIAPHMDLAVLRDVSETLREHPGQPPSGLSLEAVKIFFDRRRTAYQGLLDRLSTSGDGFILPGRSGGYRVVGREVRPDGDAWRVTFFDADMTPFGHDPFESLSDALACVVAGVDEARLLSAIESLQRPEYPPKWERNT